MWWVFQVLLGVVVVLAVYVLACWTIGNDGLVLSPKNELMDKRSDVMVLKGYGSLLAVSDKSWSTSNQFASNYLPLTRSLNRRGGIEFTYAFWLRVDAEDGANLAQVANQTILLRGDPGRYRWQRREKLPGNEINQIFGPGVLVCCPSISFGRSYNELKVSYNTLNEPVSGFVIKARPSENDPSLRQNAMKLVLNEWALMTFVFKDHTPSNDFDDGIEVSVYLNDSLYYQHRSKGAFKVNQGDFWLAPSAATSAMNNVQIGDVRYRNYAMKQSDIAAIFSRGPPKESFKEARRSASDSEPLYLSEYNKLDIYNT
jgi:hypothetical protein